MISSKCGDEYGNRLKGWSVTQWQHNLVSNMAGKGVTVSVAGLTKTDLTVTTISNVSFAASMISVGAAGTCAWLFWAR